MRQAYPIRSTAGGLTRMQGVWTGGGAAANCSRAAADHNKGISSVAYNGATGKYLVTFTDVGQQIVYADAQVSGLTGVAKVVCNVLRGSYDRTAKTVQVEFWKHDGSLIDLLTTDKVMFVFETAQNAPDA